MPKKRFGSLSGMKLRRQRTNQAGMATRAKTVSVMRARQSTKKVNNLNAPGVSGAAAGDRPSTVQFYFPGET